MACSGVKVVGVALLAVVVLLRCVLGGEVRTVNVRTGARCHPEQHGDGDQDKARERTRRAMHRGATPLPT
jgi:hypothetical protein